LSHDRIDGFLASYRKMFKEAECVVRFFALFLEKIEGPSKVLVT
jgi:hypothetical protein